MTPPQELRECPFCFKQPEIEYGEQRDGNKGYFVYCGPCDLEQFTCCDEDAYGKHETIERWNTRHRQELDEARNYWCNAFIQELTDLKSFVNITNRSENARTKSDVIEELLTKYKAIISAAREGRLSKD